MKKEEKIIKAEQSYNAHSVKREDEPLRENGPTTSNVAISHEAQEIDGIEQDADAPRAIIQSSDVKQEPNYASGSSVVFKKRKGKKLDSLRTVL